MSKTAASKITNLTIVCGKGHVASEYKDRHGSWCRECGNGVGYFANIRAQQRAWFASGAIAKLPAIFE